MPSNERVHVVKKGDTVTSILRDQGATPDDAKAIADKLGFRGRDGGLKDGEKLAHPDGVRRLGCRTSGCSPIA